jgi:hypothetical protein
MRTPVLVRPLILAAGMLSACGDATPPLRDPVTCAGLDPCALVTFAWDARPDTMVVLVTDAATIAAAHAYVATSSVPSIPSGPIVRGAGSDPRLPFHYVPDSVRLVEVAIELCDGRLMKTEAELNEYFLGATGDAGASRAQFCPWGARPVRVDEGT